MTSKRQKNDSPALLFVVQKPWTGRSLRVFRPAVCDVNEKRQNRITLWKSCIAGDSLNGNNVPDAMDSEKGKKTNQSKQIDSDNVQQQTSLDLDDNIIDDSFQLDSIDEKFQDVLSRDWDDLMDFDPTKEPKEVKSVPIPTKQEQTEQTDSDSATDEDDEQGDEKETDEKPVKKRTRRRKTKASDADEAEDELDLNKDKKASSSATSTTKKTTSKRKTRTSKSKKVSSKLNNDEDEKDEVVRDPYWYFVQVKPGCENHVAISIRNLATSLESDDIIEVFVPTTTIVSLTKGGASKEKNERYFPGYILVLMAMNRISYGNVVRITHVQGFMGDGNKDKLKSGPFRAPVPLKDSEMKAVFDKLKSGSQDDSFNKNEFVSNLDDNHVNIYQLGDEIRVISGTMENNVGKIVGINHDLNVIRCKINIFGVETSIDMNPNQIEPFTEEDRKLLEEKEEREEEERRQKEEDEKYLKNSIRVKRMNKRMAREKSRARVNSMLSSSDDTDFKQASVASAADDLAALLADDDDTSWDPLASNKNDDDENVSSSSSIGNKSSLDKSDDGFMGDDDFEFNDDEGFSSADIQMDTGKAVSGKRKTKIEDPDFEFDSDDEDDGIQNFNDDELFDSLDGSDNKKDKSSVSKKDKEIEEEDDIFSWLNEKRPSQKLNKKKSSGKIEKELDQLLGDGDIDDIWDAKQEKYEDEKELNEEFLNRDDSGKGNLTENETLERLKKKNFIDDETTGKIEKLLSENEEDNFNNRGNNDIGDFTEDDIERDLDELDDEFDFDFGNDYTLSSEELGNDDDDTFGIVDLQSTDSDESGSSKARSKSNARKGANKKGENSNKNSKGMLSKTTEDDLMAMMVGDDFIEKLDQLEPVVRLEGEESIEKLEPQLPADADIDYDELVLKKREEKEKRKRKTLNGDTTRTPRKGVRKQKASS